MKCNFPTRAKRSRLPLSKQVKVTPPKDYPWKVLGWLHDDLTATLGGKDDLLNQIIRDRDFYSLSLLSDQWGLQNYSKTPVESNEHISKFRARYQLSALLKKFRFETDKASRISTATDKFIAAEDTCSEFNTSGYKALTCSKTEREASVLTYARSYIEKVIGRTCPTRDIVTQTSRHGPGSNLDTSKGQSNKYFKFNDWPYSCTSSALPYARFLISTDKRWLGALEDSYRSRNGIAKHMILNQKTFWDSVLKVVPGNRIAFVPKNALTERSIAIEPSMNLMLQLGVDGHIRSRLKRWDVDLDSQTKNQIFAYRGSINPGPNGYITLDLAAASDTISLKLCELLLPPEWYSYLLKLRSPYGTLGNEVFNYQKISSMGNGFTFALESLIFASLCYGAIRSVEGTFDPKNDYCIFGDDIIVRKKHSKVVMCALNSAGFKLNRDKSFFEGVVKESCGTDWVHGKPVRPVYFDETPTSVMDLFVDINRLKRILELRWGITDSVAIRNMKKWIPERCRSFIGPYSDEDFDTHLHTHLPTGQYKHDLWTYKKLTRQLSPSIGKNFLFRKLMHDLRGSEPPNHYALSNHKHKYKVNSGGSRFTVHKSYSYTVSRSYSVASHWQSDYAEQVIV